MRVAFVVNTFSPRMGGLEQHLSHLCDGLARRGHSVTVLTISDHRGDRHDGGVRVLTGRAHFPVADVISFPSLGSQAAIARFLQRERIDIVSTHTRFFPMSFVGLRAAHEAGIPVVHTEHGSGFVTSSSPVIAVASRIVDLTMGHYVLHHADTVLAVSEEAASFAQRLGGRPVSVFHNAIDPTASGPNVIDRPAHLVFVGRLVPGKGWETFLDSVHTLRTRGRSVSGEILGTGVDLPRVRERVRELGLEQVVSVRGRVSPDAVRKALAGATLVNPTVLSEGFQTTLLEALAERGRVVTYDVPGAELLRRQGLPVRISPNRDTASLVEALTVHLNAPLELASPDKMEEWTWPVRSGQYEEILTGTIADYRSARM